MAGVDPGVPGVEDATWRVSYGEREQVLIALREHMVAGRLTLEEFCERVDVALRARAYGELAHLQDDLPAAPGGPARPRHRAAAFAVALLGSFLRCGRFRLRRWAFAASVLGDLDFDLRDATLDRGRAGIGVLAVVGNVDIYVPEGVHVDVAGLPVLGHCRLWGRDTARADAPSIDVRVLGVIGTVDVWRVPSDMQGNSYREILRALRIRQRQIT